ncbi:RNA repair transcriptional activator RtcR [Kiloniella laminariae]|uniref:RNA repair transcriptional activator RtcR n=1 Tax=Kiloniella laminariae TaxID=454162 RepID=A0ABT4LHW7_9PROT|nr:RNA repair transcriptional activator RtcR [Kiloniella laminariae]MCZ4280705.1 RNA repair transcriptional activator RtcR [Kiloniella laminariae]
MKSRVVIGFLGTTLDTGMAAKRWQRWRPSVALCQQPELPVDRLELIRGNRSAGLARSIIKDIAEVSPGTEVQEHVLTMKDPWDFSEAYSVMYDFARSYPFDPEKEDYLVNITTGTHVTQICWFLLTEAHFIPARLLQLSPRQKNDRDYSPAGTHRIIDLDLSRYDEIATRFSLERDQAASFLKSGIATRNPTFNQMIDQIEKVAIRSKAPVLLTGPTGAGKSQLGRRIFELKKAQRQISGTFIEVNCATLRGDQAMSTLFGHVKGAFTGAQSDRAGLMKSADKGMLFLDEIAELGPDEQAMCLRAIEEKKFLPVGSDKDSTSDFQLLAGTNKDLASCVRAGTFREDLFARLNLWTFQLPALKDRREDIEPNLDFELQRYSEQEGDNVTFNKEARSLYLNFAHQPDAQWRANFRDLSASVTRMATLAPRGRIDEATVKEEIQRLKLLWGTTRNVSEAQDCLRQTFTQEQIDQLDLFDQSQLATVLRVCRDSKSISAAGRTLFAVSRNQKKSGNDADRLRKYLQRFGLSFDQLDL